MNGWSNGGQQQMQGMGYQQQQPQMGGYPQQQQQQQGNMMMNQQGMGGFPQQGNMMMNQQGMGGFPQQGNMMMNQQGMGGFPQQGNMMMNQQGMGGFPQQGNMMMNQQGMGGFPQQGSGFYGGNMMNQQPQQGSGFYGGNMMNQQQQQQLQQFQQQQQQQQQMQMQQQGQQQMGQPQQQQQQGQEHWIDTFYKMRYANDTFSDTYQMSMDKAGFCTAKLKDGATNSMGAVLQESLNYIVRNAADAKGMTSEDILSITAYSFDFGPDNMNCNPYYIVNNILLHRNTADIERYFGYILYLIKGLRKLGPIPCNTLYRGLKDGVRFTQSDVGKVFKWDSFTSTTTNEGIATNFLQRGKDPVLFTITGSYIGYNISTFSVRTSENEVIIEPGFTFMVKEVSLDGKRVTIEGIPTRPVLQEAVAKLITEEKKRLIQVTPEDLAGYYSAISDQTLNMSPANPAYMWTQQLFEMLVRCDGIENVKAVFGNLPWDPNAFKMFINMADQNQQYRAIMKRKIMMTVTLTTANHFPTLSNIKRGINISNPAAFTARQLIPIQPGQYTEYSITTPKPICGLSTKIPEPQPVTAGRRFPNTTVYVIRADTMEVIKQVRNMFPHAKITCLNMGGQDRPGGGWKMGVISLEELLFMRTTLSASLEDYLYPMRNLECIYTKDVTYIRNGLDEGYRFLNPENEQFKFDVVTTCAFNLRKAVYEGNVKIKDEAIPFSEDIRNITFRKIESIFSACANNGADVLVLGALGCGAFKNPPFEIANLFRQVIMKYAGYFNTIFFSILDNNNTPEKNAAYVFAETIIWPGAGNVCAGMQHQNITDVGQFGMVYGPMQ